MEASGSNVKKIKAVTSGYMGHRGPIEVELDVISSENRIQIGNTEFDRYDFLEAIGVTENDLKKVRGDL